MEITILAPLRAGFCVGFAICFVGIGVLDGQKV